MLIIINILIIIFILIIIYQIFLAHFNNNIIEGLDSYKEYDPSIAMELAEQNAGNIEVLRSQLSNNSGLKQEVEDLSANVANLTQQMNDLSQAQKDYLSQKLPADPPDVSGADNEDDDADATTDTANTS
jgi:molecular chaperone GrpE (heat shock protein)